MRKVVMQGNEAIARGAWEAGVKVAAAYPGTPSSEILRAFAEKYPEVYAEWSVNEMVAVQVAGGAALAGVRAMASMKHVGMNVASDAFMTFSYTGVKGGLVILIADDPFSHSSQNEQDSRNWARFGKVPMLEPSDSQECKDFTKLAFEISEQFDTPVLVRSETRVSHSDSLVVLGERVEPNYNLGLDLKDAPKYTMVPMNVRQRRKFVEERMKRLEEYADTFKYNVMEINDTRYGIISSGVSYLYAKEVFPDWSFLKLGMVWPLPKKLLSEFFKKVKKVAIVEELDPFLETEIRALGFKVWHGKDVIPTMYELSPEIVEKAFKGKKYKAPATRYDTTKLPPRPPILCAGCSHRPLFYALKKLRLFVFGDIGCYTLATAPPLEAIHSTICMGAGVGMAHGAMKALGKEGLGKSCAVLGDSTFLHAGMPPLLDVAYNKGNSTTIILDNSTTAMTGHQEHPGTGYTARMEPTVAVSYEEIGRALGIKSIRYVNPYNVKETMEIIREEVNKDEPSLIICKDSPCILLRRAKPLEKFKYRCYFVDTDKCRGCKACLEINCPAISWRAQEGVTADGHKRKGVTYINPDQCVGCSVCEQICRFEAIRPQVS
ncbi:MAG: indolepyruvate ferredoxin oxidoreductase subunit alpha [Desulfobacterota bacterium]|nr:indolepyruvate ferredoxin oxidoreductase subunit alpha [Thermodesulfobacteriota bacterium]MDW8002681.1 indolepyruvate ferredoxin oxidoreductase subunit alpha [Deltaproteobacteria bacterium]